MCTDASAAAAVAVATAGTVASMLSCDYRLLVQLAMTSRAGGGEAAAHTHREALASDRFTFSIGHMKDT